MSVASISVEEVLSKAENFLLHTVGWMPPNRRIVFVEGKGAILRDINGKEYIDAVSGTNGPLLIGHSHPRLVEAVQRQVKLLSQHFGCFDNVPAAELAEKLARVMPSHWNLKKSYIAPGGGDAVEAALKLIMKQTKKSEVLSLYFAYHGASLATLSLGGIPWLRSYIPGGLRWPTFRQIPNPYCYRCHFGLEYPDCDLECAKELEGAVKYGSYDNVAAFILEPVQGPGGHIEFPKEYFAEVQDICDDHEILIIADEVQTGLGRCGAMFACELYDFCPDVVIAGKALGGGLPIGAAIFSKDLTPPELEEELWHSFTFQNTPLVCAAASTVLDIIIDEKLPERAVKLGDRCRKALSDLSEEHEIIGDIRGPGFFIGVELVRDRTTKEPAIEEAKKALYLAVDKGLITWRGGLGNVLKIKPPLTITEEQVDKIIEILDEVLHEVK